MKDKHTVVVIGCGQSGTGVGGHSIGYAHGKDWHASLRAELIGACDLDVDNESWEKVRSRVDPARSPQDQPPLPMFT